MGWSRTKCRGYILFTRWRVWRFACFVWALLAKTRGGGFWFVCMGDHSVCLWGEVCAHKTIRLARCYLDMMAEWMVYIPNQYKRCRAKNKRLGCLHSLALRLFREINKNRISAREHHERSSNKHVARTITKYMYIQCDKSHHFPAIYIYEVGYPKVTGIILGRWVLVLLIFFRCNLVDLLVYYNKHKFIVRIAFLFP